MFFLRISYALLIIWSLANKFWVQLTILPCVSPIVHLVPKSLFCKLKFISCAYMWTIKLITWIKFHRKTWTRWRETFIPLKQHYAQILYFSLQGPFAHIFWLYLKFILKFQKGICWNFLGIQTQTHVKKFFFEAQHYENADQKYFWQIRDIFPLRLWKLRDEVKIRTPTTHYKYFGG